MIDVAPADAVQPSATALLVGVDDVFVADQVANVMAVAQGGSEIVADR